jgi:hypothetical protein
VHVASRVASPMGNVSEWSEFLDGQSALTMPWTVTVGMASPTGTGFTYEPVCREPTARRGVPLRIQEVEGEVLRARNRMQATEASAGRVHRLDAIDRLCETSCIRGAPCWRAFARG